MPRTILRRGSLAFGHPRDLVGFGKLFGHPRELDRSLSPLFHRLRNYPGPFWAKVTRFWAVYHAYHGDYSMTLWKAHKRYGDAVRIGPNDLSILDPAVARTIHGVAPGSEAWLKGKRYDATAAKDGPSASLQGTRDVAEHNRRRRIWDKGFTTTAIAEYEKRVAVRVGQLIAALEAREGEIIDLAAWLRLFAWDIMSDMAFGEGFTLLIDGSTDHELYTPLVSVVHTFAVVGAAPWIAPLRPQIYSWMHWNKRGARNSTTFLDGAKELLAARIERGLGDANDVFHYLLGEDDESGTKLTPSQLNADSFLVVSAGSDTTSVTLASLFFHLINDSSIMDKLRAELSINIDPSELIPRASEVANVPFAEACISEALRMYPGIAGGLQRISPSNKDTVLQGIDGDTYVIPPDTHIHTSVWAFNRARWSGPSPESFSPQRFIDKQVDKTIIHNAFGWGMYSCAGKRLAIQELRLVMGALVRAFDFQFAEGFEPNKFLGSFRCQSLLNITEKLLVVVKKRQ